MINSFEPNFQKIAKTNFLQENNLCPDHHKKLVSEKHKKLAICKNLFPHGISCRFLAFHGYLRKNRRLEMARVKTFRYLCKNSANSRNYHIGFHHMTVKIHISNIAGVHFQSRIKYSLQNFHFITCNCAISLTLQKLERGRLRK